MHNCLIPIKPSGSKRPFFYVHGADGHTIDSLLSKYIDSERPFYGLRALGRDGKAKPHTSVEEMAAYYIREIQTVQPEGAYLLGGRCTGGNIALEMAQQLKKRGQDVLLVVMVDSLRPYLTETEKIEYREALALKKEEWMNGQWMRELLENKNGVDFNSTIFEHNLLIPVSYTPKVYSGRVVYFASQDKKKDNFISQLLEPYAWNRWVTNGLEIYSVPGNHGSMTKEPNVQILASQLSDRLNHAESRRLDSLKTEKVMLKEKGYSVINLLSQSEVENLLKIYRDTALPDDIRLSAISATVSSSERSYRQNISQQIRKNLERKLTEVFPNHKIALCTFINKYPNESNDVNLHQDKSFTDEEKYKGVNLWLPLTNVDERNGCFYVIEKSHVLNLKPRAFNRFVYDEAVRSLMKQHYLTSVPMKAGQALLYSSSLFHGSFANRSNSERLAIACILVPKHSPVLLYHSTSQNPNQVRVFEVEDTFYDTYIRGSENAETLTNSGKMRDRGIIDCSLKPITPEQLVEFMSNENPRTKKNIRSLFNLLRGQDWWFYKIPPLLAIAYAEILTQDISPHPSFTTLLALTVSMFCIAAYGHVVNDIFDIEVDKKAGKPNRMASLSRGQRTGLSLGLAVLGLMPWGWIGFNPTSGILLAAIYLLLTVYPAPPLRLKERFVFGAVADAATVHAVPTLLVATVFANLAVPSSSSNNSLAIIATSWAFAVGIRGILLHQMWDRDNDFKSGIQTLATKLGVGTLRFWINSIIFPLEAILSTALVLLIAQSAPFFLIPCAAYGLLLLLMVQNEFNPSPPEKYYIVLHDFYEVWLPLSLLILLSLHQPIFLIILGVHIALFYPAIQQRVLVSIRQIKLNLAKMNIFQSHKTVNITKNQPQPETFLSQPANDVERSLVQAIEFLRNNQLEDGEFVIEFDRKYKNDQQQEDWNFDSSNFATSLILYSLNFLKTEPQVQNLTQKGLVFLKNEMIFGGLWKYWSAKNDQQKIIPPDLDDICCISHLLKINNIPVPNNQGIILGNRNHQGIFYTWVLPRSIPSIALNLITFSQALSYSDEIWQLTDPDDVCSVVNANVLLYLGENKGTEKTIQYLVDLIVNNKEEASLSFYDHPLSLYYMVSRAYFNGVTSLKATKTPIINKIANLQKADGSFGNELLTALAICTLLNFNHIVPSLEKAIQFLLNTQQADGSWQRIPMYGGQADRKLFGSEALTTGFCVEALARYRLLNLPATQPETFVTLTPQMQKELEENGYVVLDRFLSEAELQDLREFDSTHPLPEDITNGTTINTSDRSYRQQVNQKLTSIVNPKLVTLLPGYRTAFCTWYRKSPNSSTNATPLHHDPSHTSEPDTLSFGIWFPLMDVDPGNSCLHVVKGSHHLNSQPRPFYPFIPFSDLPLPDSEEITRVLSDRYLAPIPLKAGQAILYDKRLIHSATANLTPTERIACACLISPVNEGTQIAYMPATDSPTLEIYEVDDEFYNHHIYGDRPNGDGVKLIKTEPYTYDPLTPELIAEKLDPLHPDRAISRLKTQLSQTQAEMQQQLETEGYVVLENFLTPDELEDLREFDRAHPLPEDSATPGFISTATIDFSYRKIFSDKFKAIATSKLSTTLPGYRAVFCLWFRKKSNSGDNSFPLHQGPYFTDESRYPSLGIWCPLTDVDVTNSCLYVVKGSHRLNLQKRAFYTHTLLPYGKKELSCMEDNYLTPIPLKAGQAILFDRKLFHGSTANTSDTDRIAVTCFILIPNDAPLYFCYRESEKSENVEIYEVPEDFYDRYILGEKPSGDGVTLIKTEPYTYDPLTPELIAEKLDPLHPDRTISRLKTQLAETQTHLEQSRSQLQGELTAANEQLHQKTTELATLKEDYSQTQAELEHLREQLQTTQTQHQQTQAELKRDRSQLQQTQAELERDRTQHQQTQTELERDRTQLQTTRDRLKKSQSHQADTQAELNQLKAYLQQTQGTAGLFNYYRHCINHQPDNLDLYQEALTLQPDNLELRLQLGQTLTQQNRPEEAITTYQTALESHPHWQLYFALGQTLEQVKRDTEAIAAYEKAIQLNPHHSPIYEHLGDLLAEQNQLSAASQYYRRVLELQQGRNLPKAEDRGQWFDKLTNRAEGGKGEVSLKKNQKLIMTRLT